MQPQFTQPNYLSKHATTCYLLKALRYQKGLAWQRNAKSYVKSWTPMRVIASDDVQHLSTVSPYADPSCASPSTSSTCTTCRITTPTSRVTECAAGLAPRHGARCPAFLCHLPPLRSPRVAASRERGAGSVAGHGHCLAERRPQRSLPLRLGGSTPRIAPTYSSPTRSGY